MLIVLALLLFAVAGVAVYIIAADGTGQVMLESFGLDTEIPVWGVFVAGAVTMLVVFAAVATFAAGMRAARARRTEIRYLRQKVATQDVTDDRTVAGRPAAAGTPTATDEPTADAPADDGRHSRLGRWRRHRTDETHTDKPPAEATHS
ncbi:hypothetical protein [Jiangella alkaliphila]|uniref:Lipopolysaccharide assembly protein A domain-containing protein n=1 Tax=Jiangella alkaliphila TaxID=419479 RepID=A0A1H2I835_9ACTN|nr:hypothetical protein [Jiangella alkaliphila]SDU40273.1 hypothetical protein SAMN04488563_1509 [Jiangella alkaliphila]